MSKISFNKNKFLEYLKVGASITLIPLTLASCSTNTEVYDSTTPTTSIESTTNDVTTTTSYKVEETTTQNTTEATTKIEETTKVLYSNIKKVVEDDDFPIYTGTDENGFNYLITEDNQKLSTAYDYYELDPETRTIKTFHKTAINSDLKTWFDLYSYDGEQLLHNLSYTTFDIIPGTDLVVYKFEETDNYGILRMRTDHCERVISSAFVNVGMYQPEGSTDAKDKYILGTNEDKEIFIYDTDLNLIATGDMNVEEACIQMENDYAAKQETKASSY